MRRLLSVALVASALGCVTYTQDLDRAKQHYEQNQYEAALAVFRVLEPDLDSFNTAEQAKYAYLRGMTDYRLSSLTPAGSNVSDPKRAFRSNSRHWLGVASAIEKETPGGLTDDEKKRMGETLADLNRDVYGGADLPSEGDKDKPKDKEKAADDKAEKP
jgi:hypothetical protein